MLQEVINKLVGKLKKAEEKLADYEIRLAKLISEGKEPRTPSPRTLGRKYISCGSWLEMYQQDVRQAKEQLALYESADFNAIRQTIKEQTGTFKQMFIDEMVKHANFIVAQANELIDCYRGRGKYSVEEMEGMVVDPAKCKGWFKYPMEESKVLGPAPENRFTDEYDEYKKLHHNAWTQVKLESEFSKVRNADRYDLEKAVYGMPSWKLNLEKCQEEQRKNAEYHFSASLTKLALRIMEHGLNWDNLKIESAHVGANLNCIITDGERKLEAFTILAYGPIVSPHYRFLIKERKI